MTKSKRTKGSLRGMDPRMSQLVRTATKQGCGLERRTKHLALRFPDGQLLTVPSSSEGRTGMNFRQELRRRGLEVPK